jgi:hypothetical protein
MTQGMQNRILVPIHGDEWAPDFRCGHFAIVDTGPYDVEDRAFFCVRLLNGAYRIIRTDRWTSGVLRRRNPQWCENYGLQFLKGQPGGEYTGKAIHYCDGPFSEKYMRKHIVGRVAGVLGEELRFLPGATA